LSATLVEGHNIIVPSLLPPSPLATFHCVGMHLNYFPPQPLILTRV